MPSADAMLENRFMRRFGPQLEKLGFRHPNLWHLNKRSAARGVAVGLASGLIPGPLQMISALVLVILFRVNLPVALVTTFYTNPFTIVPLYLLAYTLGGLVTGESVRDVRVPDLDWNPLHLGSALRELADWVLSLGSTLVIGLLMEAALFAVTGYLLVRLGWRLYVIREWRRRGRARRQNN